MNGTRPHPPISPRTFFWVSTPAPHLSLEPNQSPHKVFAANDPASKADSANSRALCTLKQSTFVHTHEPCIQSKQPYVLSNEPCTVTKDSANSRALCTLTQSTFTLYIGSTLYTGLVCMHKRNSLPNSLPNSLRNSLYMKSMWNLYMRSMST